MPNNIWDKKEDEVDESRDKRTERRGMYTDLSLTNVKETAHKEDLGVDGRMTFKILVEEIRCGIVH